MCGIVGYIGNRDSVPIILDALARLEYRGYDSAGIAVIDARRRPSRARKPRASSRGWPSGCSNGEPLSGAVGVGHTRWATHGGPSDANAHPHVDCRGKIAVVHNGIIENYATLRARLIELGHTFASETDTEVLAHLIELHYDGDLEAAVRRSLREVRGAYALGVISSDDPDASDLRAQRREPAGHRHRRGRDVRRLGYAGDPAVHPARNHPARGRDRGGRPRRLPP